MQNPQEAEESLSTSEQLPSFTPVENPKVESTLKGQGVFTAFKNASLRTQQLITASTSGLISSLVVMAVIQLSAKAILSQGTTAALSQLIQTALVSLVTALAVGVTTFALGRITTNQISRGIDDLQTQFNTVASGGWNVQATVYFPKELGQLAISFNQMTQAVNSRLNEAKKRLAEQEKVNEDLQHQLVQLLQNVEETFGNDLTVQPEDTTSQGNKQAVTPQGTILDFFDHLQSPRKSVETINPALLLSPTKLEEMQQHKDDLLYREVWLQALMDDTQRELKFLSLLIQTAEQNKNQNN